jgi:hypothetical protein
MKRVIALVIFDVKRLIRRRLEALVLVAIPIVAGSMQALMSHNRPNTYLVWACPAACLAAIAIAIWLRASVDRLTRFAEALHTTPLQPTMRLAALILFGAVIFAFQMAIFFSLALARG